MLEDINSSDIQTELKILSKFRDDRNKAEWDRTINKTVEIVLLIENSKLLNLFKPLLTMHYNDDLSATGETESWQKVEHLQSAQEIDKGSEKPMPFRRLAR